MKKVNEYKQVIDDIKNYVESSQSTTEERKLMYDLLGTIRYSLEFQLLKSCYMEDEIYNSIVPDIDSKIIALEDDIRPVKEKVANGEDVGIMSEIKIEATDMALDRCNRVKEMIDKHDFINYIALMNKEVKNSNQIIGVCTNCLSDADISLVKNFNVDGKDYTIVDLIYLIETEPRLFNDLKIYFALEEETHNFNKQEIEDTEKLISYLKTAKAYERELREYMILLLKVGVVDKNGGQTDKEIVAREDLAQYKARLEKITDEGLLSQLINKKDKNTCLEHIRKDEKTIEDIKKNKYRLRALKSRLSITELAPIIEIMNDYDFTTSTPEYKARDYLRATMNKTNFLIGNIVSKLNTKLAHLKAEKNQQQKKLKTLDLSPIIYDLIEKYHDDTEKLLKFLERDKTSNISPIFSAYVLKALHLAKNLSVEEIKEAMSTIPSENYEIVLKEVERIVHNTIDDTYDTILEVQNRTPYDTKPYYDIKIR